MVYDVNRRDWSTQEGARELACVGSLLIAIDCHRTRPDASTTVSRNLQSHQAGDPRG
jgi:hypothetical protein